MHKKIIEKWYRKLGISSEYDREFYSILDSYDIDTSLCAENYCESEPDGKKNLLYFLYFCEDLSRRYEEKGISEDVLFKTLTDLTVWIHADSKRAGTLSLYKLDWLKNHLSMKLFAIGIFKFHMRAAKIDIPSKGIKKGENVMDIHIPSKVRLLTENCLESLDMAREFFERFFPEYEFRYFACSSWLLDETLADLVRRGEVTLDAAAEVANDPAALRTFCGR